MGECRIHGSGEAEEGPSQRQELSGEAWMLDEDPLMETGDRERLVKRLMEKYGWSSSEAERRVSEWDSRARGLL